ncbi:NAD(P)H-dependent oxidoreductase [Hazenella sp. IB182357]|uniref:NAD(P)H-dependent oxidoreductase n=1 Tax=Polycladospora coralii TaxID=2771432 RepID=A0A926N8D7_9BACL|nr:NAD(P)H-dependent oxidoreductase [Polycladospora coralii]MBD1371513.1 NAD(P)H-dependent oxidoreductase [Polycladospora coralii]MBS7528979.1 NAD(P)H-dependent oxidoreductase [Polycladospora coralii]
MKIVTLLGSSRDEGNSEALAQHVCAGLDVEWIKLRDLHIKPVVDQRHDESGFTPVIDDYDRTIQTVMEADLIIFATPLYWYGMSGILKNFIDRWSQSLRDSRYDFRANMLNKPCYVLITGGDAVHLTGLPLVQQFNYIFDFMSMDMKGYILGKSGKPGDIINDKNAWMQASALNTHLKEKGQLN